MATQPTGPAKQSYERNFNDWVKGMNATDNTNIEGGFSPRTTSINPVSSIGAINPPATYVSVSSTLDSQMIASCDDGLSSFNRIFLDASGNLYTLSGNVLSVGATSTKTFTAPYSDLVYWGVGGNYYATQHNASNNDISQYTAGSLVTDTWFSTNFTGTPHLDPNAPHPLLVKDNNLYIGDRYQIHAAVANSTATAVSSYNLAQLSLSAEWNITAMVTDPSSGLMLVAHSTSINGMDGTHSVRSRIGYWDGTNPNQFRKIVEVDDVINSFRVAAGTVYCVMLNKLCIFNGTGLQIVRQLNVTNTLTTIPFKHQITNNKGTIYVADTLSTSLQNGKILAYGQIASTYPKSPYYASDGGGAGTATLSLITSVGANKIAYSYYDGSKGHLEIIDTLSTSAGTATFYDNSIYFPRPIRIKAVDVFLNFTLTTGSHTVSLIDDTGTSTFIGTYDSSIGKSKKRFYNSSVRTTSCQIKDVMTSPDAPLGRVIIYYDFDE